MLENQVISTDSLLFTTYSVQETKTINSAGFSAAIYLIATTNELPASVVHHGWNVPQNIQFLFVAEPKTTLNLFDAPRTGVFETSDVIMYPGFPHTICLQWHDVWHNPPDSVKLQVFCDRTSLVQWKFSTEPILKMCCPWSPDELVEPFSIIGSRQKLRCKWQAKCNHLLPNTPSRPTDSIW